MPKGKNARGVVREELLRACNNLDMCFMHVDRAMQLYEENEAPDHAKNAEVVIEALAAIKTSLEGLRDAT